MSKNGTKIYQGENVKVMEAPTFLVQYELNGKTEVALAVQAGNEVRFFEKKALSGPAVSWLSKDFFKALHGTTDSAAEDSAEGVEEGSVDDQA